MQENDKTISTAENGAVSEPLTHIVARELREAIYERRLKPGAPIRQETLAKQLGMSRVPVREALRQLESEGLVVIRPNSGARVAVLDFAECVEIYKIRERLEPLALAESIGRLSEEQVDAVVRWAAEVESLTHDQASWIAADRRLHLAMYAGAATPRLPRMIESFWNTTQHYRKLLLSTYSEEDFLITSAEHRLMVHAVVSENPRFGEEILRVAMERARSRLEETRHLFDQ